ncbi:hypothetical protein B0H14DRAFT_2583047 [Mycena olivaceomarginata]|nr:hypothetical protein B0H14DRAFT_2583047 [Mycena olivaceomarginata]
MHGFARTHHECFWYRPELPQRQCLTPQIFHTTPHYMNIPVLWALTLYWVDIGLKLGSSPSGIQWDPDALGTWNLLTQQRLHPSVLLGSDFSGLLNRSLRHPYSNGDLLPPLCAGQALPPLAQSSQSPHCFATRISLSAGQEGNPVARYLGDLDIDSEGAAYTVNQQWERAFQVPREEQRQRIVRGKFGLDLVCPFLEFFSQQHGIKGTNSVGMLARRIYQLNKILDSISDIAVLRTEAFEIKSAAGGDYPGETRPRKPPNVSEEDSDEPDAVSVYHQRFSIDVPLTGLFQSAKGKAKASVTKSANQLRSARSYSEKSKDNGNSDAEAEPADGDDAPTAKAGRNPKRSRWVISNYTAPPAANKNKKGDAVWRWDCKWCRLAPY